MADVRLIYATSTNLVIGRNNKLPWHLPDDLARFKRLTHGDVVVMGKYTWQSLPGKSRPLKDRINVVLSTDPTLKLPGAVVMSSMEDVLAAYPKHVIWCIGGTKVLEAGMEYANSMYLTLVLKNISNGDAYAPITDTRQWELISSSDVLTHESTQYQYLEYKRINHD